MVMKMLQIYPDNATHKVLPSVISHVLDVPLHKVDPIICNYMPLDKRGRYVFSGRAFKEAFPHIAKLRNRQVEIEDVSHLRVIKYGDVERKMTLGTFMTQHPEGSFILILENGYTVGLSQGKLLANATIASRPKSRLFRIYRLTHKID